MIIDYIDILKSNGTKSFKELEALAIDVRRMTIAADCVIDKKEKHENTKECR